MKIPFVGKIGDVHQLPIGVRVDCYSCVGVARICGSNDEIRSLELTLLVFFAHDLQAATRFGFGHLLADLRRDDSDLSAGISQCERFASAYSPAANDDGLDALTVQCDREITHRNCPRLSDASRNTTYNRTTLPKVTADMSAARLACQPRNTRPRTSALTASQAASPQMS